jgi:L-methionine (R)-S-oxide reductase
MDTKRKQGRYERLFEQAVALNARCRAPLSRMSTLTALLYHKFDHFFWIGFYTLRDGELLVGPYQGPVACMHLPAHTGVCWAGIDQARTIIVPDVHAFPGHIACDSRSRSEIVVPVYGPDGVIIGVLDADSEKLASYDEVDAHWLEKLTSLIYV